MNKMTQTDTALGTLRMVPLSKVVPSKTNPRRHFPKRRMDELQASIERKGIEVPLILRPLPKDRFEIVAGERRYMCAVQLRLKEVPGQIRVLNDYEARDVQIIENLHREDVHPLDEAFGYKDLLATPHYKGNVKAVALEVGKEESYIYLRLQLTKATKAVQDKLWKEEITVTHATHLSRLQPDAQAAGLKFLFDRQQGGFGARSVKELEQWIAQNVMLELKKAVFDHKDAELVKKAGSCIECPKRTGFTPALFPDIKGKDTCTDPTCYMGKVEAHIKASVKAEPDLIQVSSEWGRNKHGGILARDNYTKIEGKDACEYVRDAIVIEGRETVGSRIRICAEKKCTKHRNSSRDPEADHEEQKADQRKKLHVIEVRRDILQSILHRVTAEHLDKEETLLVCRQMFSRLWHEHQKKVCTLLGVTPQKKGYSRDFETPVMEYLSPQGTVVLNRFLIQLSLLGTLDPGYSKPSEDEGGKLLIATAERYGVDVEAVTARHAEEFAIKEAAIEDKRKAKKQKEKKKSKKTKAQEISDKLAHNAGGVCVECGCADEDCSQCIEKTGQPCTWVDREHTLCSACAKTPASAPQEPAADPAVEY